MGGVECLGSPHSSGKLEMEVGGERWVCSVFVGNVAKCKSLKTMVINPVKLIF